MTLGGGLTIDCHNDKNRFYLKQILGSFCQSNAVYNQTNQDKGLGYKNDAVLFLLLLLAFLDHHISGTYTHHNKTYMESYRC